jgi:6-phosphogluconolactonase
MNRLETSLLALAVLLLTAFLAPGISSAADEKKPRKAPGKIRVYIGTYTGGDSQGIYVCELDRTTGQLSEPRLAAEAVNPSFLAVHPKRRFLYAVGEIADFEGAKSGGVSAFRIQPESGQLKLLNQQSSKGAGPCHLVVDPTGKNVLVANYGGGSVACLPIQKRGKLGAASAFIQHEGSSVNPKRQEGPHAHSINVDPENRFAMAADLGLDKVLVYRFDPESGTLTANDPASVSVAPGGGPRHFAFHPSGKFAFTNNEITSTVTAFSYDAETGVLKEVNTVSTLPPGTEVANSTAEVRVHRNGRWVYVSNRGHNSIAIFEVDPSTGKLTPAGHASTQGEVPRNFNLDPSGRFLLAANQSSNNVVVFRVRPKTGQLKPTGSEIKVASPVCIRFVRIPPEKKPDGKPADTKKVDKKKVDKKKVDQE